MYFFRLNYSSALFISGMRIVWVIKLISYLLACREWDNFFVVQVIDINNLLANLKKPEKNYWNLSGKK